MSKRIIALLMCVIMLVPCLVACGNKNEEEDPGAYITMYLTDEVYDFDPANAFYNADTFNVVSMLFDTLFTLDDHGKVKKSLVDKYEFLVDKRTGENCMEITLKEAYWSNGAQLSTDDVVYAWKRLLNSSNSYAAASLLFDIKNARAVKEGSGVSIDNIGIEATGVTTMKITFEGKIDYDQFLVNLTSLATAPLMESRVEKDTDWAKKPSTIVTSGAFKLGKIFYKEVEGASKVADNFALNKNGDYEYKNDNAVQSLNYFYLERNPYYYRDTKRDKIDSSVKSYRILVDCSKSAADIFADYQAGKIFYMGNIPLSLRTTQAEYLNKEAEISNSLSTFTLFLNQYAVIDDGANGSTLFANADVRKALSLAIDREAIAREIVYAEVATGLVPSGVFNAAKYNKKDFRDNAGNPLVTTDTVQASALLQQAGIDPAQYSFAIKVAAYDDVHVAIANKVKDAWVALGFKVTVQEVQTIQNNDYLKEVDDVSLDICEDLFVEALRRNDYEVAAFDYTAYSADAYSVLSNFANAFSGTGVDFSATEDTSLIENEVFLTTNTTGYVSMEYNILMEAIYYIPYYKSLDSIRSVNPNSYLMSVYTEKPYITTANALAQNATRTAKEVKATLANVAELTSAAQINRELNKALQLLQNAAFDIERSYAVSAQTYTNKATVTAAINSAVASCKAANKANNKETSLATANELLGYVDTILPVAAEADVAADLANGATLYDLIGQVYAQYGITPSTKSSDWSAQKSTLLHKAEEILMKDMVVIPVVFNQNAVLIHKDLSKVDSTYYIPAYFRKTKLKNYDYYTYTLVKINIKTGAVISKETASIFDEFPTMTVVVDGVERNKWDFVDGKEIKQYVDMG